jgi:rhodanese-related sulfurtransferase
MIVKTIIPQELHQQCLSGSPLHLIDVRTPAEHAEVHACGVRLIPLHELNPSTLEVGKDEPVYLFCRTGGRAEIAAQKLSKAGFNQCCVVEGGTQAWTAAGLPVERGACEVISLERQVRIAAGSLALSGALLTHFVHPGFIWLPGFIGAGLIFAGVTNWCGMGELLARMPWNRA